MLKCENCCYFTVTDDESWNGKEHCCFHEWGHGDWETAPCDEPEYDDEPEDYYDYDETGNAPCDNSGFCVGAACSMYFKCQGVE